ncbi:MAG: hypothetical protein AB7R89_27135 [Dehalococcoidia bacterium]
MPKAIHGRELIRCKVSPGMFKHERGVQIEIPGQQALSLLVDRSQVRIEREPAHGEEVDGWLEVTVIGVSNGRVIVDLPQPTFTTGTRVAVPRVLLRAVA